jgi:hypothetical protein
MSRSSMFQKFRRNMQPCVRGRGYRNRLSGTSFGGRQMLAAVTSFQAVCSCRQHSSLPHVGDTQGTGWTMLQEINCCYTSSDRKVKFISIWMKWDEKDKGGLHRLPVCWGSTKRPSSRRKRTPVIQLLHTHSSIPTHPNMAENKLFRQNISRFPRLSHFVIKKTHVCSAYLRRFKLMEHAICVCSKGDQIIDHLINQCALLQTQKKTYQE